MSGLENVEAAKVQDMSVIITKEGKRLSANVFLALELVFYSLPHLSPKTSSSVFIYLLFFKLSL